MTRPLSQTISAAALLLGASSTAAWAQDDDRDKKDKRRVLKADDMDTQTLSEEYRRRAREKRHESMDFLKDILANRNPQGTQKAEMMFRLAELYYEEGRDIFFGEMQAFIQEQERCYNTPGCDVGKVQPNNEESRDWSLKAIKLYKMILRNYPQYQRADEATFFLANALTDTGDRAKAVNEYKRLVRTYPESKYVPDAYVQIGEYYFDENEATKALFAYQSATRFRESSQYAFAMYKLAWCQYNVGEYGKAIDTMKRVVDFSMNDQTAGTEKKRLTLQEEALKDLVRFFADAGNMDDAYAYFNRLGKKDLIQQMLKRLASMYFEQGKFDLSITTYRRLIRENPNSPKAPDYQNEIILAYQKTGRKQETLDEIRVLLDQYGKQSAWARSNASNPDAIRAASTFVEQNLRTVAQNYQIEADKLGRGRGATEAYALAETAYSVYLQEFPEGKYTYDMRYAYGELLYKLKKYDTAYDEYVKVVKTDPKGKHSLFCSESAIFAADEMRKVEIKEGRGPKEPEKGNLDAIPLTEWEERYIAATRLYGEHYGEANKDDNNGFVYEAAYIYYNHNMLEEAQERFLTVIQENVCAPRSTKAANLILDAFTLKGDTAGLKNAAMEYQKKALDAQETCTGNRRGKGLASKEFNNEVGLIYESSSFTLIEETLKANNDQKMAAKSFWGFYEEFPTSQSADIALNNVAVYAFREDQLAFSMQARTEINEKFPKSKFHTENLYLLGYGYETIADYGTASQLYEQFFAKTQDHENSKRAIGLAATYKAAAGDYENAIKNYKAFITAYPDDKSTTGLKISVARTYFENERWAEAGKAFYALFSKPPADLNKDALFYCRLMHGRALEKQGKNADQHWRGTLQAYERMVAAGEQFQSAHAVAAEIRFKSLESKLKKYYSLEMNGPGPGRASESYITNILKSQLKKKVTASDELDKELMSIYEMGGGEWSLKALVELGHVWLNFSDTVVNSYVPSFLTEDQANIYKMNLEDRAYTQKEKSANYYAEALSQAFQVNLYNESTETAIQKLAELRADEYPKMLEELIEKPRYTTRNELEIRYIEQP